MGDGILKCQEGNASCRVRFRRHSFATHLLEDGHPSAGHLSACDAQAGDIRAVQELLGYRDVKTTMAYTYVPNRGQSGVRSPVDAVSGAVMELLMPRRIRSYDRNRHLTQQADVARARRESPPHSRASYAALQTGFGMLGGSA